MGAALNIDTNHTEGKMTTESSVISTTHLQQQLESVRVARHLAAECDAQVKESRQQWEEANAALLFEAQHRRQVLAEAESLLRSMAEAHYLVTKEKKPAAGIEIKIQRVYEYSKEKALEWAKRTGICLIPETLDERAFNKVAAASTIPLDFVTVTEKPTVTIATNLDKAMGAATEAPAAAGDVA